MTAKVLHISLIYVFNSVMDRRDLWNELEMQCQVANYAWSVLGDFNCILSDDERVVGKLVTTYQLHD